MPSELELLRRALRICPRCNRNAQEGKVLCFFCSNSKKLYLRNLTIKTYNRYGGVKCACCGITYPECLNLDHIHNNGAKHRRELGRKHIHVYLRDAEYPEGEYRVLCVNCNMAYGYYGRCFHQDGIGILDNLSELPKNAKYHRRLKRDVINHYGGECVCCGEKNLMFLQANHIHGGGKEHLREIGRGHLYRWIKVNNYPEGFNIMCGNCNFSLGMYGYCPHNSDNRGK